MTWKHRISSRNYQDPTGFILPWFKSGKWYYFHVHWLNTFFFSILIMLLLICTDKDSGINIPHINDKGKRLENISPLSLLPTLYLPPPPFSHPLTPKLQTLMYWLWFCNNLNLAYIIYLWRRNGDSEAGRKSTQIKWDYTKWNKFIFIINNHRELYTFVY